MDIPHARLRAEAGFESGSTEVKGSVETILANLIALDFILIFVTGGVFAVNLKFDENFNNIPPSVRFHTVPFHPNSKC